MFSWLKSPTGQGLFSPNGGLALSVTNTPRGMYGFFGGGGGATTTACATSGKTPYTPSANLAPSANLDSSCFFTDVEGLPTGGEEVASPKATDNQRSMICISPLASQKTGGAKKACAAPETPMSINFSEVFASPRYTPRFRGSAKKDGNPSPVISALHVAERDVLDDEDLSDLLQLAGTTTPGGRPLGLLSPLLTSSFRKMASKSQRDGDDTPPDSLQLPMISGKSTADGPMTMLARKGSPRDNYTNPPQLSIRSTSSGVLDDGAKSSQKKCKPKKRKASDIGQPTQGMGPSIPAGGHHHHHQGMGYPHPNMLHYRHHPGQMQAPLARHNSGVYYHQPHQHHAHPHSMPPGNHHPHSHMAYPPPHPAPQHHYAYSEQQSTATASSASSKPPRMTKRQAAKEAKSKGVAKSGTEAPAPPKKKAKKPPAKKPKSNASTALEDPEERERVAAAIRAVNESSGGGNEKAAALAAAILRGVTMRPSGKWQAQLYYAGKSRYIGVFDSREKAALAYEIAREVLKTEKGLEPTSAEETDRNVTLARKAAFAGVNESNLTS